MGDTEKTFLEKKRGTRNENFKLMYEKRKKYLKNSCIPWKKRKKLILPLRQIW